MRYSSVSTAMSEETQIPNPNLETPKQTPLSDESIETLTLKPLTLSADQTYHRNTPSKRGGKKLTNFQAKKKIQALLLNLKPNLFLPKKNLNLEQFDHVLKKLKLFDFTLVEFDPVIRIDLLAELVANYDPKKKCSYVNGFRINVARNDLARALKLPYKKPKKGTKKLPYSEVYSDQEIGFIEDFVFDWMLVNDKDMVPLSEIAKWLRCIRDGRPDKMDAAELIWCRVEKELTQGEKLVDCYYASHLQCLIRSQRPSLFFEDCDGVGIEAVEDMLNKNSGDKEHTRSQFITQVESVKHVPDTDTDISLSSVEFTNEARAAKRLKSTLENLGNKTDRELRECIWMNKRNVGILEQNLPEKAVAIKEAIKCYEDEIERRARLHGPKENGTGPVTCITPVKVEVQYELLAPYENVGDNMVGDGSAVGGENTETHEDVNQESTQDICAELKKVSCVLSMLSSPNKFYTPQGDPLDEEAEKAKQTFIELLNKNFETIVGSPDEERVKSCIAILTKNVHKLPRFQGRVIQALNTEFDLTCQNWKMWHTNHQSNIEFEVQQGDNLRVLKDWQERNMEIESKIETVHADILQLKAKLREKELTQESLVKEKSDLFYQSKMSIDEVKMLLQEMVTAKLQSDVAVDNMNELETKWERTRDNFQMKQV